VAEESVVELDDLLLRRTDWGSLPAHHATIAATLRDFGLSVIADSAGDTSPSRHAGMRDAE
jgi:hypothetical protein